MRKLSIDDLKFEYRLGNDGDAWGHCMQWWFAIADEIEFNRDFDVPADWQFRPSPLGLCEDDEYMRSIMNDATDDALRAMGAMVHRLAGIPQSARARLLGKRYTDDKGAPRLTRTVDHRQSSRYT